MIILNKDKTINNKNNTYKGIIEIKKEDLMKSILLLNIVTRKFSFK